MATVVDRSLTGTQPTGTGRVSVLQSVNTPDYPLAGWIHNPDLSGLTTAQKHWKVVGDLVVDMTPTEQAAVDAWLDDWDAANLPNAQIVSRTVATTADLPLPPPRMGLFVGVADTGSGVVGLAISGAARWYVFNRDLVVGP